MELTPEQKAANDRATKRANERIAYLRAIEGWRRFVKMMSRKPGHPNPSQMKPVKKATGIHIAGKRDWKRTVHKWRAR